MPKLVGMNHIALEVGDIDEALAFWESIFGELELRGRGGGMAFIDMGDQFIALARGRTQPPDQHRHFGLVVDDKEAVRERLRELGVPVSPGRSLDFHDPWGNFIQVVDGRDPARHGPRRAGEVGERARGAAREGLLGAHVDRRPERQELRQPPDRRIAQPDAAVTDVAADQVRLVRTV
jgi:catechol 2,3-dioxygenase-like lactoylglutathione lyase family enzyme